VDRRSWLVSAFGGLLAALGLRKASKRWEGMIPAGLHRYVVTAKADPADATIYCGEWPEGAHTLGVRVPVPRVGGVWIPRA